MIFLTIATIVCIGLMIGVELAVSAFINPVLWRLEEHVQTGVIGMFAARLGAVMPFWYGIGLVLLLAEAFTTRQPPAVMLLWTAIGVWVMVIVLTLIFLVPINNRLARFGDPMETQKALYDHHRWDRLHRVRIVALVIAMILFLAAILRGSV